MPPSGTRGAARCALRQACLNHLSTNILPFTIDGALRTPAVSPAAWIAPDSWVIGDCVIGSESVVLFGAVVRGDLLPIRIGCRTNIQDGAVIHTSTGLTPTVIGDGVTVGHRAVVHGCTVENDALIGMGAIVLDGAVVGAESIVGANALVTKGTKIPPRSLVLGSPARIIRVLTDAEVNENRISAAHYVQKGIEYRALFGG
jgi:carbonic anhydrase/acetyltransferase-like protein (isoleucine patch superfamily)